MDMRDEKYSQPRPATPDVHFICQRVKAAAEEKAGHKFAMFFPLLCRTRFAAGCTHLIKVHVGDEDFMHMIVLGFGKDELVNIQYPKTMEDPLVPF